MVQKASKIDDIKRPEKITPSATARPILVTNHSTLPSDPMMAPGNSDKESQPAEQPMSHSAKTITPLDASLTTTKEEVVADPAPAPALAQEKAEADVPTSPKPATVEEGTEVPVKTEAAAAAKPVEPAPTSETAPAADVKEVGVERDGEAAISAEEAAAAEAEAKRNQELEEVIASGKYAVPINAVQRRRSRIATIFLFVCAVLLALVLLDIVVDVGIVHVPSSVPHTHFFSRR